jgi:predicted glycosyltransferase involved in capsule biosynthesis
MNQMAQNFQNAVPSVEGLPDNGGNRKSAPEIAASDITVVLSVRLHADNPWILDRLTRFAGYYAPRPKTIVVDFGSSDEYARQLQDLCKENSYDYLHVEDQGVFSLAAARNAGVARSTTDLVFLSDPDCLFAHDFFGRIARLATSIEMMRFIDVLLMCPVYHLSESTTERILETVDPEAVSKELEYIGYHSIFEKFGRKTDFIAPYSNIFLINRRLFDIAGGYDPSFRGHGSEDFEFFIRLSHFTNYLPLPESIEADEAGPMTPQFASPRRFRGFRVLSSMIGLPGLLHGLKTYHLHHPRLPQGDWLASNDWKRERMKEALARYSASAKHLLEIDGLPREKKALCVCIHEEHWGYFVPLRALGYAIIPIFSDSVEKIEAAASKLANGEADVLVVFNPYMDSHKKFRGLFYMAQEMKKAIVIERGALPGTIYYASDVAYNDMAYSDEEFSKFTATAEELAEAGSYVLSIRNGETTLEKNFSCEFTNRKYLPFRGISRPVCFVPLQLEQDMAVTMFLRASQRYREFVGSIEDVANRNPDILFIVKPHPLSKASIEFRQPNIILADQNDNIHSLIELASFTVCYNSGVGLISIMHERPTYTVGNAYYNVGEAGVFCDSLENAVVKHRQAPHQPRTEEVLRLVAWLKKYRYSSFSAIDDVREFADRRSHGYKRVVVNRIVLNGQALDLDRAANSHPFGERSFGLGVLGLSVKKPDKKAANASESGRGLAERAPKAPDLSAAAGELPRKSLSLKLAVPLLRPFMRANLLRKLKDKPDLFFRDAKSPITRMVGRVLGMT